MNNIWLSLDNIFKQTLMDYANNNDEKKFKEYAKAVGFESTHVPLLFMTLKNNNNCTGINKNNNITNVNNKRKYSELNNDVKTKIKNESKREIKKESKRKKMKLDDTNVIKNETKIEPVKSEDETQSESCSDVDSIFDENSNDSNENNAYQNNIINNSDKNINNIGYIISPNFYFSNSSTVIQMARVLPLNNDKNINMSTNQNTGINTVGNNMNHSNSINNGIDINKDNSENNINMNMDKYKSKKTRILNKDNKKRLRLQTCSCETKGRGHRAICHHIFDTINSIHNNNNNNVITLKYNKLKQLKFNEELIKKNKINNNINEQKKKKLTNLFNNLQCKPKVNSKRKTPVVFGYGYAKMCKNGVLNNFKNNTMKK